MFPLSLLLLAGAILGACGGGSGSFLPTIAAAIGGSQSTTTPSPVVHTGPKVRVVILSLSNLAHKDSDPQKGLEALIQRFNASHDNIEASVLVVPPEEAYDRYLAMVTDGNAPQLVGPCSIGTIASLYDTWEDLIPYIQRDNLDSNDFFPQTATLSQYGGKTVGLPVGLYPSFILYNRSAFDAVKLPYPPHDYNDKKWTVDKLRELAMQLTFDSGGHIPDQVDFNSQEIVQWGYADSHRSLRGMLTMWDAPTQGRGISDNYRTALINSSEWLEGMSWVSDGIWSNRFIQSWEANNPFQAAAGFARGTQAMLHTDLSFFTQNQALTFQYDVAPVPFNRKGTRLAPIEADIFAIPANASYKQEAWEVLKWLLDPQQMVELCQSYGCLPARASGAENYRTWLAHKYPGLDTGVIYAAISYLDNPNHEGFIPEWSRVEKVMNAGLNQIFSGEEKDAEKVLGEVNGAVQQILDDYWATHK